jgi:hypothetical protein
MGYADNVREGTIELLIRALKTETNPKKIERGVKALMKYGLSQEDIDKRLSEIEEVKDSTQTPHDKGYKKGNFNSGDQVYVLSCTHQIRAKKRVGILSKGMLGKSVWCDVCNAERVVTSQPSWVS